ncbi:MAG: helix-turn-helix transcriptional regulator [Clostridia bacterium]|nr:helix-turn-helix transcriptional regulator [Clostridia bacterium]
MNLGENIYTYRTMKHFTQGDLAEALDVSRQSVSKW